MDDEERLERIEDALSRLSDLAEDSIILVEGLKDIRALEALGISGRFHCVQSGGGPLKAAEHAWGLGVRAVVMTDWDRRGGNLAQSLREGLGALGVPYDDGVRRDLAVLCCPFCKDVESLDSVVAALRARVSVKSDTWMGERWEPS